MDTEKLREYIFDTYSSEGDNPFDDGKYPIVFRHADTGKWFGIIMNIPKEKLGIYEDGNIEIINLKCEFVLSSSLLFERGIFPAYHMNKNHWISVALDGSVDEDRIKWLLEISFQLTNKKIRKR